MDAASPNNADQTVLHITKGRQTPLMETAMAMLSANGRSTCARLLFDSGAAISLITSKTAQALQARRINCPTRISGIAGDATIRHLVKLNVCSSHSAGEGREVTFHVIEGDLPVRTPDLTTV